MRLLLALTIGVVMTGAQDKNDPPKTAALKPPYTTFVKVDHWEKGKDGVTVKNTFASVQAAKAKTGSWRLRNTDIKGGSLLKGDTITEGDGTVWVVTGPRYNGAGFWLCTVEKQAAKKE